MSEELFAMVAKYVRIFIWFAFIVLGLVVGYIAGYSYGCSKDGLKKEQDDTDEEPPQLREG